MKINEILFFGFLIQKQIDSANGKQRSDKETHAAVQKSMDDFLTVRHAKEIDKLSHDFDTLESAKKAFLSAKYDS